MWNYKKVLSILLITTFISTNMPITILAQGIDEFTNKIVSSAQVERNSKKEAKILQEVESKREKFIKTYIKEDKSYEAVVYPIAAHFKENGVWKDIDNNLSSVKDEENNDVLENKNNSYKVKFGKTSDAKKLVSIKKDGYEISWNINSPSQSNEAILSNDTTNSQITDSANAANQQQFAKSFK